MLDLVRQRVETRHAGERVLLVVDTMSKWSRVSDENDATAAMAAYRPLAMLTQDLHVATLVNRHARKGDHDDLTDTARGSNAASGEADIILSLGRPVGRPGEGRAVRTLRGVGRFGGIPEDIHIEIRDGEYVVLPDGSEVQAAEHQALVERYLLQRPDRTAEDIAGGTGITRTSVLASLAGLTRPPDATVTRSGRGVKGEPFHYRVGAKRVGNPAWGETSQVAGRASRDRQTSGPIPATPGPFSTASRAHGTDRAGGIPTGSTFLSKTPADHPHARERDDSFEARWTDDAPEVDLVAAATAAFGDAPDPNSVNVDAAP